jgi:hypothetical protein
MAWTLEVHNPTDAAVTTRVGINPSFDLLRSHEHSLGSMTILPGASVTRRLP